MAGQPAVTGHVLAGAFADLAYAYAVGILPHGQELLAADACHEVADAGIRDATGGPGRQPMCADIDMQHGPNCVSGELKIMADIPKATAKRSRPRDHSVKPS